MAMDKGNENVLDEDETLPVSPRAAVIAESLKALDPGRKQHDSPSPSFPSPSSPPPPPRTVSNDRESTAREIGNSNIGSSPDAEVNSPLSVSPLTLTGRRQARAEMKFLQDFLKPKTRQEEQVAAEKHGVESKVTPDPQLQDRQVLMTRALGDQGNVTPLRRSLGHHTFSAFQTSNDQEYDEKRAVITTIQSPTRSRYSQEFVQGIATAEEFLREFQIVSAEAEDVSTQSKAGMTQLTQYSRPVAPDVHQDVQGATRGCLRTANMIIKLRLDFSIVGAENSIVREAFVSDLSLDLAQASGLAHSNFHIKRLSPGSIIVDTEIRDDESGKKIDPEAVIRDLERQVHEPRSPLRSGVITRFIQGITLRPQVSPSPQLSARGAPESLPAESEQSGDIQMLTQNGPSYSATRTTSPSTHANAASQTGSARPWEAASTTAAAAARQDAQGGGVQAVKPAKVRELPAWTRPANSAETAPGGNSTSAQLQVPDSRMAEVHHPLTEANGGRAASFVDHMPREKQAAQKEPICSFLAAAPRTADEEGMEILTKQKGTLLADLEKIQSFREQMLDDTRVNADKSRQDAPDLAVNAYLE
jgi:hypothetical protein